MEHLSDESLPTDADQQLATLYPGALVLPETYDSSPEEHARLAEWGFAKAQLLLPNNQVVTALYVVDASTPHARAVEQISRDEAQGILPQFSHLTALSSISCGTFESDWISYYIGLFEAV